MILLLKTTWTRYKNLKIWEKVLLFLPLIIAAVLCIFLFFVKPSASYRDKYIKQVKRNKEATDREIEQNQNEQEKLKEAEEEIKKIQETIKKEIEENHEKAETISNDIDDAVSTGNIDKLKRIHTELKERTEVRSRGTDSSS